MNEYDVRRLAMVLAIQAEIEGMKAINKARELYGEQPCHLEHDFIEKAIDLRELATINNDNLELFIRRP